MTLNTAAWAIDGARMNSALARTQAYHASGGGEGIVGARDLKVTALGSPGQGFQIAAGAGSVLNRYQGIYQTNQCYTVTNLGVETVASDSMPALNPSDQAYLVAIVIGDPEFSQSGHPWMTDDDPAEGTEETFNYVRVTLIPCGPTETALSPSYSAPALVLARINIPANITVITNAMITDLRALARARTKVDQSIVNIATPSSLNSDTAFARWPDVDIAALRVPIWATRAMLVGWVEGVKKTKAVTTSVIPYITTLSLGFGSNTTSMDEPVPSGPSDRMIIMLSSTWDVSTLAGLIATFQVQAKNLTSAMNGGLTVDTYSSITFQIVWAEVPI